jgi:glycosyl transferase family 87
VQLNPRARALPWFVLAASLLACFGVWRWAEVILVPSNTFAAQSKGTPIGNNSDLYPRWLGTRELLLHHRDPYGVEVTREIQTGFYGRPIDPLNPHDRPFKESFVYPLYVVFLMAPATTLPFGTAVDVFRWLLLFGLALSVPLWMCAVGFRPRRLLVISAMVLVVSSFPAVLEFHMQNLAALVIFFLAAAAAAAVRNWLALCGFLLALATTKPDTSGLMIVWFLLWATGRWSERKRLVWGFVGTMAALLIAAEIISPHWVGRFLMAVRQYPAYGSDPSILQIFLPSSLAKLSAGVLVSILCALCWRWRKAPTGTVQFGWALAWVASVTLAVIPKLAAYNQPLLIPALLVLLDHSEAFAKAGLFPRALAKAPFMCLLWQWGTAVILSICSLLLLPSRLQAAAGVPEYTLFALPAVTILAVLVTTFSLGVAGGRTPLGSLSIPQTPSAQRE